MKYIFIQLKKRIKGIWDDIIKQYRRLVRYSEKTSLGELGRGFGWSLLFALIPSALLGFFDLPQQYSIIIIILEYYAIVFWTIFYYHFILIIEKKTLFAEITETSNSGTIHFFKKEIYCVAKVLHPLFLRLSELLVRILKVVFSSLVIVVFIPMALIVAVVDYFGNFPYRTSIDDRYDYFGLSICVLACCVFCACSLFVLTAQLLTQLLNYLATALYNRGLEINGFSFTWFACLTVGKVYLDLSLLAISKLFTSKMEDMEKKHKKAYLKSKMMELQLSIIIVIFAVVVFFPKSISLDMQNDVINVVTFFTLLMLYLDKRTLWEKEISRSHVSSFAIDTDNAGSNNEQLLKK